MPNILSLIADNPALLKALKQVLEKNLDTKKEELNHSDSELGQIVRARLEARRAINDALREISTHRSIGDRVVGINPGA